MLAYGTLPLAKGRGSMMGAPLQDNGGPSRLKGGVIDLTNSDDDEPSKASKIFRLSAKNLPIHPPPRNDKDEQDLGTQDPAAYATKTQPPPLGYKWVNFKRFGLPESCRLVSIADGSEYGGNAVPGFDEHSDIYTAGPLRDVWNSAFPKDSDLDEDEEDEENKLRLFGKRDARPYFHGQNNNQKSSQDSFKSAQAPPHAQIDKDLGVLDDWSFGNFRGDDDDMPELARPRNRLRSVSPLRPSGIGDDRSINQNINQEGLGGWDFSGRGVAHSPHEDFEEDLWAGYDIDEAAILEDEAARSEFVGFGYGVPNLPRQLNGYQGHQYPPDNVYQPQNNENIYQAAQGSQDVEDRADCIERVAEYFPGICKEHISELYDTIGTNSQALILHLLDQPSFPKAVDHAKNLKRKRSDDKIKEELNNYDDPNRIEAAGPGGMRPYIRNILSREFTTIPFAFIDPAMKQNGGRLWSSYMALHKSQKACEEGNPPYNKIKPRRAKTMFDDAYIEVALVKDVQPAATAVLVELREVRAAVAEEERLLQQERDAEAAEAANYAEAKRSGTLVECGCCSDDVPLNRSYQCNAEITHFFCKECMIRLAEHTVGAGKYALECMSTDGCAGGYAQSQRNLFLTEQMAIALDRAEAEASLRNAGIENLESCPFCPFAMEYVPVYEDKEFRCQHPECLEVSCRLCREKTHIPKTCEEYRRDQGISVRHRVDEAMSRALIRNCNKCNTPFIKEEGCNKMTCTQSGCRNIQCYICSKSCDYNHFNDPGRGGKIGNCPLFDAKGVHDRHENEVSEAQKAAMAEVLAEHPEYTEEDLQLKISERVKADEQARRGNVHLLPAHEQVLEQARAQMRDHERIVAEAVNDFQAHRAGHPRANGADPAAGAGWNALDVVNNIYDRPAAAAAAAVRVQENNVPAGPGRRLNLFRRIGRGRGGK